MCFDKNINKNRDVKFLGCDELLVQRCVKLTLVSTGFNNSINKDKQKKKEMAKVKFCKLVFVLLFLIKSINCSSPNIILILADDLGTIHKQRQL